MKKGTKMGKKVGIMQPYFMPYIGYWQLMNAVDTYVIYDYVKSFFKKKQLNTNILKDDICVVDEYIGKGYGKKSSIIDKAIYDMVVLNGIPLDPTYTGKAFLGMRDYIIKNNISNKNVLFIHTGGTPLFFDNLRNVK